MPKPSKAKALQTVPPRYPGLQNRKVSALFLFGERLAGARAGLINRRCCRALGFESPARRSLLLHVTVVLQVTAKHHFIHNFSLYE